MEFKQYQIQYMFEDYTLENQFLLYSIIALDGIIHTWKRKLKYSWDISGKLKNLKTKSTVLINFLKNPYIYKFLETYLESKTSFFFLMLYSIWPKPIKVQHTQLKLTNWSPFKFGIGRIEPSHSIAQGRKCRWTQARN